MKDPGDRTKVVLRRLPPTLSQPALADQIDVRFAGRYNWFCFRPGKSSHKNQPYSRAYIDFKRPEDVVEFAEFFDGHVFVNEKGSHFKTVVEYAPSQRVPKPWSKKDGREGTILKDVEFLEFLELLAKPVENLPSAEVQLERREAERGGGAKDSLIVTPLMDYVRQKRAAKSGSQRLTSLNGKLGRRVGGVSSGSSSAVSHKRGLDRRRMATATYVMRDNTRIASSKDKSTYVLVPRREELHDLENDLSVQGITSIEALEDAGASGKNIQDLTGSPSEGTLAGGDVAGEFGKRKLLLSKGKEKEVVNSHRRQTSIIKGVYSAQQPSGAPHQQGITSSVRGSSGTSVFKQNQRHESSGRVVRGILSNKDLQQSLQSSTMLSQAEQQNQASYTEKGEKMAANDFHGFAVIAEKQDKRTRNKDRPDRPVWTPRRRADGVPGSDESQSYAASASMQASSEQVDGSSGSSAMAPGKTRYAESGAQTTRLGCWNSGMMPSSDQASVPGEVKSEMLTTSRSGDIKAQGSGRSILVTGENGNHRQVLRRASTLGLKESDISVVVPEAKPFKRGGVSGYGCHEKQVWVAVQKSGSGS